MEFLHNGNSLVLREATIDDVPAMTDLELRVNPQGWSHVDFTSSIASVHRNIPWTRGHSILTNSWLRSDSKMAQIAGNGLVANVVIHITMTPFSSCTTQPHVCL